MGAAREFISAQKIASPRTGRVLLTLWLTLLLTFSPILPSLDPLILIGSNTSRASVITWDGEAGDARWSNPLNWDADRLPHPDEVARFAPEALIQPADQLTSESGETSDDDTTTDDSDIVSNVSIDVDVVVSGVEIADDFVGTIGTEAISLTVGSHGFRQAGGRFIARTSSFDLNGSLTVTDGIFVAPDTQLTISGHLNLTTPHFSHNAGTITLDGFNQLLFGAATFYNLEKTTQLAQTLELQSNSTFVIDNTLKLKGTIREPLTLTTTKSDPAFLEPKHAADLSYLHVNNIINLSPNHVACTTCTKDHATSGWGIETEADSTTIADRIAELFSNPEQLIPTPSLTDEPTLADTDRTPTIAGTTIQNLTLTDKQTADFEADEDITFTLTLTDNDTQLTLQPATLTTDTGLPADIGAEELPTTAEELQDAEQEQQDTETAETVPAEELDVVAETPEDATTSSDTDVLTDVAPADEESSESDSTEPLDSAQGKPTTTTEATEESGENPPEISSDTDDLSLLHYLIRPADASTSWGPGDVPVEAPDGQSSTDDLPLTGSSITAQILDPIGHETDIEPTITQIDGDTIIHVDAPTTTFRPGTYTLRVEATINGQTVTQRQDFTWGVLALNTSQSTYQPGDTVDIGMAVLDDEGHTLCNADLILTLTDPAGATETLTTEPYVEPTETDEQGNPIIPDQPDAAITRSSACGPRTVTNTPDYQTTIPDTIEGTYTLHLTATTENGTRILERDVLVTDTEPFTVTRTTATRIWPGADYQVQLTIEANQPFLGTITESVPSVFEITELSSNGEIDSPETTIADPTEDPEQPTELETLEDLLNGAPINASDSPTQLIWTNQAITPDNPLTLTYTYNPPDISPQFYLAGPVQLQATDTASGVGGPEEEIEPITADELPAEETATEEEETPQEDVITDGRTSPEPSIEPTPHVETSPSPEATPEVLGETDEAETSPTPQVSVLPSPSVTPTSSPSPSGTPTPAASVSPTPSAEPTVTPTPEPAEEAELPETPTPSASPTPTPPAEAEGVTPTVAALSSWIEPRQWQIASDATQTISGNCYQNDQTTACTDNGTVTVVKNGGTAVCTDTSYTSSYSCSGDISSGDVLTVYIDGAGDSNEAVSVTKWDGSGDVTGFDLIENHLSIGSDDDQTVTVADVAAYDNVISGDEDIFHTVDARNLIGWWRFDDGTGSTATDRSVNGNDLSLFNMEAGDWEGTDKPGVGFGNGYALNFDGDPEYAARADDDLFSPVEHPDGMTVSAWVEFDSLASSSIIVGKANSGDFEWSLHYEATVPRKLEIITWGNGTDVMASRASGESGQSVSTGTWYHVVGVIDDVSSSPPRTSLYVDGAHVATNSATAVLAMGNEGAALNVGRRQDDSKYIDGRIDDVRIYDRALTPDEISALYGGDLMGELIVEGISHTGSTELYVQSGDTFHPESDVIAHDIEIDGTLDADSNTLFVEGTWDNDATFTADESTVVMRSASAENIDSTGATTDTFHNLQLEDTTETSLTSYWKLDDGYGTTAVDSSVNLNDGTLTNGPTWKTHEHDGLIGYWKFDDGSGTSAVDSSGRNLTGTLTNMEAGDWDNDSGDTATLDFTNDYSLQFDGVNEYIDLDTDSRDVLTGATELSASLWYKTTSTDIETLIGSYDGGSDDGFAIEINRGASGLDEDKFYILVEQNVEVQAHTTSDVAALNDGNWHNVIYSWTAADDSVAIYFDGVAQTISYVDQDNTGAFTALDRDIYIGAINNAGSAEKYFTGHLDDVRLYDRYISANEAASIARGEPLKETTPTTFVNPSFLEFDGTDDYVAIADDSTLEHTDGTLTIAAWVHTTDTSALPISHYKTASPFDGYGLGIGIVCSAGEISYWSSGTGSWVCSDNTVNQGYWRHIAAVQNSGTVTFYADGTSDGAPTGNSAPGNTTEAFFLGRGPSGSYYEGGLDDVRIYDYALSADEVANLANGHYADGDDGVATFTLESALDVDNDLFIQSGILDVKSGEDNAITLEQDWNNFAGTGGFVDQNGTVTLDGADNIQNVNGATTFYNFTANDSTNNATDHTIKFEHSVTFTIANTLTMDGTDNDDEIVLDSSDGSTQFTLDVTGADQCVTEANVSNSAASSNDIYAEDSTNGGGNDDGGSTPFWVFGNCPLTFTGTVYTDEGSTNIGANKTVQLAINGTDDTTDDTDSNGAYSITTATSISATDILTLYLQTETEDAVTVTESDGNDLSGVDLYQDYLITRHDNAGSLTNADLDTADGSSPDADLTNIYTVDASDNITVPDGNELLVWTGDTYAPGANITADDIDINGTLTLAANDVEVHGSWDATGGTFTSSGEVMFTSTADETITSNSNSFNDLYINDGLRGYWKLDEGTGTNAADSSGYGNDGTLTNGPAWANDAGDTPSVSFENPYGVHFDGTDDIITMGTSEELRFNDTPFSASLWIKLDTLEAVHALGNDNVSNGWVLGTNNSDFARIIYRGTPALNATGTTTTLTANKWHNLAATFDGTELAVYLDGVQEDTDSTASTIATEAGTMSIGGRASDGGADVDGLIDDVRIYSRVLTADELSALAAGNQPTLDASSRGLVGLWRFDETATGSCSDGQDACDSSTNNNHGTHTDSPTISTTVAPLNISNPRSIDFDGTNDYVDISDDATIQDPFSGGGSIGFWLNPDTDGENSLGTVISKRSNTASNGWTVHMLNEAGGSMDLRFWAKFATTTGHWTTSATEIDTNAWNHVVITFDSDSSSNDPVVYVDGVSVAMTESSTPSGSYVSESGEDLFVAHTDGYEREFDGNIDDVRIYDRALSASEAASLGGGANVGNFNLSDTLDVNGDLILNSGELDADAAITVAGSWHNNGGKFNESTQTVTFDGSSGSHEILSGGQEFYNTTFATSGGTWDLYDDYTATNTHTQSNGTLNANEYTLYVDDWEQTAGTFTSEDSTLTLTSSDDETISTEDTLTNLHTEDPQENGFVGYWKFDEGQGTTVVDSSSNSNNGTLTNGPLWKNHAYHGLAGYWKFDETSGTTAYDSVGTNDGTHVNTPTISTTVAPLDFTNGRSLEFDGSTEYVNIDGAESTVDSDTTGTLSLWVRPQTVDATQTYVSFNDTNADTSILIQARSTNVVRLFISDSAQDSSILDTDNAVITNNEWMHIAATQDATAAKLFIGGVEVDQTNSGSAVGKWFNDLTGLDNSRIGNFSFNSIGESSHFDGNIDDVRVYSRALTASEIANIALGKPLDESTFADFQNPSYLHFDGSNDYVLTSDINAMDAASALTLSAWVNPEALANNLAMFGKATTGVATSRTYAALGAAGVGENDDLLLSLANGSNTYGYSTGDVMSAGTWKHVTMRFDGGGSGNSERLKLYIDGAEETLTYSGTIPATTADTSYSFVIGSQHTGGVYWDGAIDDVRIYDYALSTDEITNLYNGSYASNTPDEDLVGFWKFNDGSGSTAKDTSKNNNDGILYNMEAGDWDASVKATLDVTNSHALHFDDDFEYVDVGDTSESSVKAVSFWMNADDVTSRGVINIDGTDLIEINGSEALTATSFPAATVYVDGSSASADTDADTWHHVAINDTTGVNASDFDIGRTATDVYDVSAASYVDGFDVSGQDAAPDDVAFNLDGTKMFVTGDDDEILEYTLSTGFDVSTASYDSAYDYSGTDTAGRGFAFNGDGTKWYLCGIDSSPVQLHEFSMSAAFDVSTSSFSQTADVSANTASPQGVQFNNDGTKVYLLDWSNDQIDEYSLSTAYDISTMSYTDTLTVTAQDTDPRAFALSNNGLKLFVAGNTGDDVNEYTLSTAWDVSSASFVDSFSVTSEETNPAGLNFSVDGTKMYVVGNISDNVHEYDVGTVSYFDGHLDDVRIYNRTLSVGEIEQLHGGGTNDAVITLDTTLDVNNDLHLHSGALDANASENNNQTIAGDLNNNDLFIPRTSTTTLDGTDQRFTGSTTVYNLTKEETSDDASDATLTFESSKLFTILNTLTFRGIDTDDRLNIDATTSGTKATLNPTSADQDTQWLDLTDTESSTYDILARRSNDTSNTDSSEASPHWIIRTRNAIQRLIGDE